MVKRRRIMIALFIPLYMIIVMLTCIFINTSIAYYIETTGDDESTFNGATSITPIIEETFDDVNKEKKDVYIRVGNTDYPVYVRAVIVINWKNIETGKIYHSKPVEGKDYTINLDKTGNWIEVTNEYYTYYYYKNVLKSNGKTNNLINSCKQLPGANVPSGCELSVEIIVESIQGVGETDKGAPAWKDAWGIK